MTSTCPALLGAKGIKKRSKPKFLTSRFRVSHEREDKWAVSVRGRGHADGKGWGKLHRGGEGFTGGRLEAGQRTQKHGHGEYTVLLKVFVPTEAAGPREGVFPPSSLLLGCPIAHSALWGTFLIILLTTCPGDPIQKTGQGEESCPRPTREERANQGAVLMVCLAFIHRRVRSSQRKEILCLEPGVRVRLVLQARDSRHTKQPGTNFRLSLTGLGSMVSDVARSLLKSTV